MILRSRLRSQVFNWQDVRVWVRGSATASAARTRTFRRLLSWFRLALRATSRYMTGCGAAAFSPRGYQGVKFQSGRDPVLYLSNPPGFKPEVRRRFLDDLAELNQRNAESFGDPEIHTRISQYEMAFRMQSSVPELTDLSKEPAAVLERYGPDARKPGTFAANCVLARRLAERGVRFIQLFHRGWDQHGNCPKQIAGQCRDTDQPTAALIQDLKDRGLLDDTLVIWGGEFGRTVYSQGKLTADDYGRDHHPRCFTLWMAGGGIKGGVTIGETDDFSYNIVRDPVSVYDLNATILHCLGIEHTRLTYKFQGRYFRLTDVHGNVVKPRSLKSHDCRGDFYDIPTRSGGGCSRPLSSTMRNFCSAAIGHYPRYGSGTLRLNYRVVTDSAGAVVPGATIKVTNVETGQESLAQTNSVGGYTLSNLAPGTYDLSVQAPGFRTLTRRGVSITANTLRREEMALELGQVTESVTVDAGQIALQTDTADVHTELSTKDVSICLFPGIAITRA